MNTAKEQDRPIIKCACLMIMGMHGSGNSLLANCLKHLGVNFGNRLLTNYSEDWGGMFKNQDIVLVHEILFRDLGCSWDMVGNLPEGWARSEAAEHAEKKLAQIIEQQFLGSRPWAVNDPRLCRLMPLWFKVLARLDIKPCFIHMVRHPGEIAQSMHQKHGTDLAKGHLLWLVHNREAMRAINRHPHILLTYDQLLADPVSSLARMAATLNIDLPCDPLQHARALTDFARPDLKNHNTHDSGRLYSETTYASYAWVYEQFRLNQAKALESQNDLHRVTENGALSDFPILSSYEAASHRHVAHAHALEMFNSMLGMIGRFEQAELDHNRQHYRRLLEVSNVAETLYAQIYFPIFDQGENEYKEETSHKILLAPGEWQTITCDIERPIDLHTGRLRIDLLKTLGTISISKINIVHSVTGEVFWSAENRDQFAQCSVEGSGVVMYEAKGFSIASTGFDARLLLPLLPSLPDCPVTLELSIKANRRQTVLEEAWKKLTNENSKLDQSLKDSQVLLDKSKEESQAIQDQLNKKIVKLDQIINGEKQASEDLEKQLRQQQSISRQYYNALCDLEDTYQNQTNALETSLHQTKSIVKGLQADLIDQKSITDQHAANSSQLRENNRQLATWIQELQVLFNSLSSSRRWKLGNAVGRLIELLRFRSKRPTALTHIQSVFDQFNQGMHKSGDSTSGTVYAHAQGPELLVNWLQQLEGDFLIFKYSYRWRFGNAVVSLIEKLLLRPNVSLAPDQMAMVFEKFKNWHQKDFHERTGYLISHDEIEKLHGWFQELDRNFQITIASRRWKIGCTMIGFLNHFTFSRPASLVTDDMQKIFLDYHKTFIL